jgi:deoxyadenosine/deoxycytidine kinase
LAQAIIKILGSIAAGKTTLAQGLAEDLGFLSALERPESNPFLPRMTHDPRRWCFANQVWYLQEAISACESVGEHDLVLDHSLEEVIEVHSPVFTKWGWLDEHESHLLFDLAQGQYQPPRLYISLDAPSPVLIERVAERGRGADRIPDIRYLNAVAEARAAFMDATEVPVLRVRSDEVDFRLPSERLLIQSAVRDLIRV